MSRRDSTRRGSIFAMLSRHRFPPDFGENFMKIEVRELDQEGKNGWLQRGRFFVGYTLVLQQRTGNGTN